MEPSAKTKPILQRLPSFYAAEGKGSLLYEVVNVFGHLLEETETDLYRVMRSHFVDTADNEGSQGLASSQQGDLDKLFALYLESLGLTAQVGKVDNDGPYRERLKALIKVLRQGASTQEGIRNIVAANLGIFGDDEESLKAKDNIQIEEFLPQLMVQAFTLHPYARPSTEDAAGPDFQHPQTFMLVNPNAVPTRIGFQLKILDTRPAKKGSKKRPELQPLINIRVFNAETQDQFEFRGTLRVGDVLRVLPNGELSRNGETIPAQKLPPWLPQQTSPWRIETQVGDPVGQLDQTLFDLSRFDRASQQPEYLTPEQASQYTFELRAELIKQTPASFRVRVPWDIPGYTDKFNEADGHPRSQIPTIINKVKAAGVLAVVAYEKRFEERHEYEDKLGVVRSPFIENQKMTETNFDIGSYQEAYPNGLHHDLSDNLVTSGVLDYTRFDTGNRFG